MKSEWEMTQISQTTPHVVDSTLELIQFHAILLADMLASMREETESICLFAMSNSMDKI
jgi:hypothetical protein